MRVGVAFPGADLPANPAVFKEWAQAVEAMGFSHITLFDHILAPRKADRPDWNFDFDLATPFHEPIAAFGFLAGVTHRIELSSGVIVLPLRQTVMFAKQTACADVWLNGRLRLGLAAGYVEEEFHALRQEFENRGDRMNEQIELLRRLWTGEPVIFDGAYHTLDGLGINPAPVRKSIPVWIGGMSAPAMNRAARLGDGWIAVLPPEQIAIKLDEIRSRVSAAGRDPGAFGIDGLIHAGTLSGRQRLDPGHAAEEAELWRASGATHLTIDIWSYGFGTVAEHLDYLHQFRVHLGM